MSLLVAYEVQTFEAGTWKISSMFNEKELALIEARRLEEGIRKRETRVVEESHDEASGRTRTKVVYSTPRIRSGPAPAQPQSQPAAAKAPAKPDQAATRQPRQARARPAARAAGGPSYLVITISFLLIVGLGLGGLVGLRYLAQLG